MTSSTHSSPVACERAWSSDPFQAIVILSPVIQERLFTPFSKQEGLKALELPATWGFPWSSDGDHP